MKRIPVKTFNLMDDGRVEINLAPDAANDDWIRSARLLKKAEQGDKEAAAKLKELEETPMVEIVD